MDAPAEASRRGILNPKAGDLHFVLSRHEPAPPLAPFVARYWSVRWDLTGEPPFEQQTLAYPCVNVVVGTHRPGVFGPLGRRFVAMLEGKGWVLGAKFHPGGFRAFYGAPISELADRSVSIGETFGAAGTRFEHEVHAAESDGERVALFDAFFAARLPSRDPDPEAERAARIVAIAESDPLAVRVGDLAERGGLSVRALHACSRITSASRRSRSFGGFESTRPPSVSPTGRVPISRRSRKTSATAISRTSSAISRPRSERRRPSTRRGVDVPTSRKKAPSTRRRILVGGP